jgi:hypothetical protein
VIWADSKDRPIINPDDQKNWRWRFGAIAILLNEKGKRENAEHAEMTEQTETSMGILSCFPFVPFSLFSFDWLAHTLMKIFRR